MFSTHQRKAENVWNDARNVLKIIRIHWQNFTRISDGIKWWSDDIFYLKGQRSTSLWHSGTGGRLWPYLVGSWIGDINLKLCWLFRSSLILLTLSSRLLYTNCILYESLHTWMETQSYSHEAAILVGCKSTARLWVWWTSFIITVWLPNLHLQGQTTIWTQGKEDNLLLSTENLQEEEISAQLAPHPSASEAPPPSASNNYDISSSSSSLFSQPRNWKTV